MDCSYCSMLRKSFFRAKVVLLSTDASGIVLFINTSIAFFPISRPSVCNYEPRPCLTNNHEICPEWRATQERKLTRFVICAFLGLSGKLKTPATGAERAENGLLVVMVKRRRSSFITRNEAITRRILIFPFASIICC